VLVAIDQSGQHGEIREIDDRGSWRRNVPILDWDDAVVVNDNRGFASDLPGLDVDQAAGVNNSVVCQDSGRQNSDTKSDFHSNACLYVFTKLAHLVSIRRAARRER
jgi:hypothetical protein